MGKRTNTLVTLALLAMVFSGPAALAAYLLSADPAITPMMVAATGSDSTSSLAGPLETTRDRARLPILTGVLYTSGTALVNWNGITIPVEDGSYAYLGGETVSTGPGAIGLLQLDGGGVVYACPGSRLAVSRADNGAVTMRISEGTGRVVFPPGTDYRIEANQGLVTPAKDGPATGTVTEISVFQRHPGGVVCGFGSPVDVAGFSAPGGDVPVALGTAGPGQIVDLSRALREEVAGSGAPVVMEPIDMPSSVKDWLQANAPYPPHPGPIGYLCRCLELKRYVDADGIPDTAIEPRLLPPEPGVSALPVPEFTALVVPADVPAITLAVPGIPDPAEAGVLPPPATGPEGAGLTVPPPLVPTGGTGGGVSTTPS